MSSSIKVHFLQYKDFFNTEQEFKEKYEANFNIFQYFAIPPPSLLDVFLILDFLAAS